MNLPRQKFYGLMLTGLGTILLITYSNCTGRHDAQSTSSSSLYGGTISVCTSGFKGIFSQGYHPFVQKNCAGCHNVGGFGKGYFAQPNVDAAWDVFKNIGYAMVSNNAVSATHGTRQTNGPQNEEVIDRLKASWQLAELELANCANGRSGTTTSVLEYPGLPENNETRILTNAKTIAVVIPQPPTQESIVYGPVRSLKWNLDNSDLESGSALPDGVVGAQIEISVSVFRTKSGLSGYAISAPTISNSSVDLKFLSLLFKINGSYLKYGTTFKFLEAAARANVPTLLTSGSLVTSFDVNSNDTLSLSIGSVSRAVLPPPEPPLSVGFLNLDGVRIREGELATIPIRLDRAPTEGPVAVTVSVDGSSSVKPLFDMSLDSNAHDWDYKLNPEGHLDPRNSSERLSLVFSVGEIQKNIVVTTNPDLRQESSMEILVLRLTSPNGLVINSSREVFSVVVSDDDPTPSLAVPTYDQLMTVRSGGGGILGKNCRGCHNSKSLAGGLDLADYAGLVAKRIVVGGLGALESILFARINPDNPQSFGARRMPLNQYLPAEERELILDWLLDGAKNN